MRNQANSRIDAEVQQFNQVGSQWWDERGPFRPLHALNPVRMGYILSVILAPQGRGSSPNKKTGSPRFQREDDTLKGLNILDIACGGGLVCEPLARLGAKVTGIDTSENAIAAARAHAAGQGLAIDYRVCSVEDFLETRSKKQETRMKNLDSCFLPLASQFDVITALEILEHVAAPGEFVKTAARLLKPGGTIVFSTINRTAKSLLLAKIAAEDILGIVPRGTHQWRQFIQPAELAEMAAASGLRVVDIRGLVVNPIRAGQGGLFALSPDVGVNYFLTAVKD